MPIAPLRSRPNRQPESTVSRRVAWILIETAAAILQLPADYAGFLTRQVEPRPSRAQLRLS
jgi:hypothetical protein